MTNKQKIAIVGTGAMGSVYAGLLADAGHEVWAIDAWQDHVDAMNANGLKVEGASGPLSGGRFSAAAARLARQAFCAGNCTMKINVAGAQTHASVSCNTG